MEGRCLQRPKPGLIQWASLARPLQKPILLVLWADSAKDLV
jgi:hypothetical protein